MYGLAALIVIKMLTLPQLYATGEHACLTMSRKYRNKQKNDIILDFCPLNTYNIRGMIFRNRLRTLGGLK